MIRLGFALIMVGAWSWLRARLLDWHDAADRRSTRWRAEVKRLKAMGEFQ